MNKLETLLPYPELGAEENDLDLLFKLTDVGFYSLVHD